MDPIYLTGRAWRSWCDEVIDRERVQMGGLGAFERDFIISRRSPERVKKLLALGRERPDVVMVNSPFASPVGQPSANPASYTPVASTNVETNLWVPSIWTPIPANTLQTGQIYTTSFGGVLGTSSAAPTTLWTPRCGQSATPASNVTLGASSAATATASLAASPMYGEFTLAIRALGLAASGCNGTGNGFVTFGGVTTTMGVIQPIGGTVATTIDNTAATGLVISLTWGTNQANNTATCQWTCPVRSYN